MFCEIRRYSLILSLDEIVATLVSFIGCYCTFKGTTSPLVVIILRDGALFFLCLFCE